MTGSRDDAFNVRAMQAVDRWPSLLTQYDCPLGCLCFLMQTKIIPVANGIADPDTYDFTIARTVLAETGERAPDNKTVDLLARELVTRLGQVAEALGMVGDAWLAAFNAQSAEERERAKPGDKRWPMPGGASVTDLRALEARLCLVAGTEAAAPDEEMLPLTRLAADYLESIGPAGAAAAKKLREAGRIWWSAWALYRQEHKPAPWPNAWENHPAKCPDLLKSFRAQSLAHAYTKGNSTVFPECKYLLELARSVWLDVVKPAIEAEKQRAARFAERETRFPVPTAARSIVQSHARLLHSKTVVCPQDGKKAWAVESGTGEQLGLVEMARIENLARRHGLVLSDSEAVRELLQSLIRDAGTVTGISTFRYFAQVAHKSMVVRCETPPVVWPATVDGWFLGGLAELARSMGFRSKQDADLVRAALDAMAVVQLRVNGDNDTGHLNLLTWDYIPRRGRTGSRIRIVLYEPLCGLRIAQHPIGERRLTPIPDLPCPEMFVGDRTAYAAQLLMQQWLMLHLTDHSLDLVRDGGVVITDRDWRLMAERAELPIRLLPALRKAYLGPPLLPVLKLTSPDRYVPGDERILAVLKEQGKALVKWSKRGSKGSREDT